MEALKKAGKVKSIGVSNCSQEKLEYLMQGAEIKPAVNQVRVDEVYSPVDDETQPTL
jgi:glycerol 2-dehydrogenase (NADP+)